MLTTLNAPRYILETTLVMHYGYSAKELAEYSLEDLRKIIWDVQDNFDGDIGLDTINRSKRARLCQN